MTVRKYVQISAWCIAFVACTTHIQPGELPPSSDAGSGPDLTDPIPGPGHDGLPGLPGNGTGTDTTDPGNGTGTDTGTTPVEPEPVTMRFIVLGDGGRGNDEQYEVAAAIEQVCAVNGCEFAVYTGDNIYDSGVDGVDDPQFDEKFEAPYANLSFPFYMALGNHDWESGEAGADAQVEYTAHSTKWTMPARYYSFVAGNATFIALDSNAIKEGDGAPQEPFVDAALAKATTTWKFAFGHHPYVSNGDHGNTGGDFESFFDAHLCGQIDVYFAGHDHDLQWLEPVCGTEFIISGAASSLRDVGGDNPTFFETSTLGFMWVEIVDNKFTGVFYDSSGNELFRREIQK